MALNLAATTLPPTTKPTTTAPCVVRAADIAFIIDASGSVAATEWIQVAYLYYVMCPKYLNFVRFSW